MGGITVATDSFSIASFPVAHQKTHNHDEDVTEELLTESSHTLPPGVSVEDLTNEVQDILMRESMASWLQPWSTESAANMSNLDANQLYAQSLQLEDLFGHQSDVNDNTDSSPYYDELTFVPDDASLWLSAPQSPLASPAQNAALESFQNETAAGQCASPVEEINVDILVETAAKRRRDSCSSDSDSSASDSDDASGSSSEEEEDVKDEVIPSTTGTLSNRHYSSYWFSSESESESDLEDVHLHRSRPSSPVAATASVSTRYTYMHKRQIEETLLDKITNHLDADKLPGILSILSAENAKSQKDEVEIDLSCLAREQLVRLLSYVDACMAEQQGGPAVNVADFMVKELKPTTTPPTTVSSVASDTEDQVVHKRRPATQKQKRKPRQRKRLAKTREELTEDLLADDDTRETWKPTETPTVSDGPISMAALASKQAVGKSRKSPSTKRRIGSKKNKDDDAVVVSSIVGLGQASADSIAVSRPKRRAALHKRRLLEEAFASSDGDDSDDAGEGTLVVYSDEQMDFAVTDNKTIVHESQHSGATTTVTDLLTVNDGLEADDFDEEIDIMM